MDDCRVPVGTGTARIDARTGAPEITIGVGDGIAVDARGRLVALALSSGPILEPVHPLGVVGAVTDTTGSHWSVSYDAAGRVTTIAGSSGTATLTYDSAGNLTKLTAGPLSQETFGYDSRGRITSWGDRGGDTASVNYDAAGHLASIVAVITQTDPTDAFTYDGAGIVLTWTRSDGIISTPLSYAHNSLGDVTNVTNGSNIDATLAYDGPGSRLSRVRNGVGSPIATFTYDGTGRLITAAGAATIAFAYDSAGRLASTTESSMTDTLSYDGLGRILGITTPAATMITISYLPAPTATTGGSSHVGINAATVSGSINPRGAATSFQFEFGRTTAYGHITTVGKLASGETAISVLGHLSGLRPATTYHYTLLATNHDGSSAGLDRTFRTRTVVCRVPHLRGDTLKAARKALGRNHCTLGHVTRPRHVPRHAKLTVASQHPSPGAMRRAGAAVKVALKIS